MNSNRQVIAWIAYIVLGAVLLALGAAEVVDAFWSGMGSALIAVGLIRSIHFFRFRKDEAYREKCELEKTDERNRFLRNKAWAWTGYLFILVAAVASIALKLLGQELLSVAASSAVCVMVILYWASYLILRRKY